MAKTDAARATAISSDTLRVTTVLFGTRVRENDIVQITPRTCSPIETGVEYFLAARCPGDSECQWMWIRVDRIKGVDDYARNRHRVTRSELMERLRAWREHRVETEELQRWLSTADADDDDGDLRNSLTLAVIERIEDLLRFSTQAAACRPGDATWLRDRGSRIYLERFGRLPKQETSREYEDWLDAHEGAKDEWDPRRLSDDLERGLEGAHSWDHTIDCFLKRYGERASR